MAVIKIKPTSPGRRGTVKISRDHLYKGDAFAPLLEPQFQKAGRNNNGHITTRHKGGGHKHHYRVVDFRRNKDGIVGRVPRRHRIKRYRPVSPKSRPPGARHRPASTPSEAQRHHCSRSSVSTYRTVSSRNKLSVMGTAKNTDAGLANRSASDNAAVCSSQRRAITV